MTCQHPNCSHVIHAVCIHHCRWSLCRKHFDEHSHCLRMEFESTLENLIQLARKLFIYVQQTTIDLDTCHRNEILRMEEYYKKQLRDIEQRSIRLDRLNQKSEMKKGEARLTQADDDEDDQRSMIVESDDDVIIVDERDWIFERNGSSTTNTDDHDNDDRQCFRCHCPLTHLGVFGLSSSHNVRLCLPTGMTRNLFEHCRNYHRLTSYYANELLKAVLLDMDPMTTELFPINASIIDLSRVPCHEIHANSRFHSMN